ncbi:MAG: redoxin domain-containing protein [Planctomycetaceae bacterium]|nr:redoxin domain-containing protein [Planctomycetaceae bacterium]
MSGREVIAQSQATSETPDAQPSPSENGDTAEAEPENPFPQRSPAPSFDGGVGWLNTSGPIELKDLRGKVVLLDFWTYCCINCIHVLPDLKYLEEKFDRELVVIGVHSAKFDNEKESEAIRDAILRYEIAHPVVNDAEMVVWRKFGARSWPTLVLIDPEGNYCGYISGEGNRDVLEQVIEKVVAYHEAKGTLDRTPVHFDLERYNAEPTPLRYPGKLLADEASNRLFISDSNHNRIVVSTLDGKLVDTVGTGRIGRNDGSFAEAEFDHPQGLALDGETLYVADTENHLIRKVELATKRVSTLAGTGQQAQFREPGGRLATASLNSPWDLLVHDGVLYVAMAGPHQIWSHELGSDTIGVFAGSGREDVINGPHGKAALAQPSGLATDGKALYVCDSEGSSIRRVPFEVGQDVTTVAGASDMPGGQTLFEFGDRDGVGSEARFQHPLGIAIRDQTLFVADSYNHKLKTIALGEPNAGAVETLAGDGEAGDSLEPLRFSEPAGLAVAGSKLFVADTNNHRVLNIDLTTMKAGEVQISGLKPPAIRKEADLPAQVDMTADTKVVEPQTIAAGQTVAMTFELALPEDYKLNPAFPLAVTITSDGPQVIVRKDALGKRIKGVAGSSAVRVSVPLTGEVGEASFRIALSYGYCREGRGGVCKVRAAHWNVPLVVAESGSAEIRLVAPPAEPESGGL